MLSVVVPVLAVELALRLLTFAVAKASLKRLVPQPSSQSYLAGLSHALSMLAPLLPACAASAAGFLGTLLFCTLPCIATPILMGWLTSAILPGFGLRADLLVTSLMTTQRSVLLGLPALLVALWTGPSNTSAALSNCMHAFIVLLSLRIVWCVVRTCLLMPSTVLSHAWAPPTALDRRLAELRAGQSCTVLWDGAPYTVERLVLERGLDALAVVHHVRPDRWIVSLPGNGECLQVGFEAKIRLAAEVGCSVIACDWRDVGRSPGLLLTASDMVADAEVCTRYAVSRASAERTTASPSSSAPPSSAPPSLAPPSPGLASAPRVLLLGQSMGGGVAAELAATCYPELPCVNERSFSSLAEVSASTIGLGGWPRVVRAVLALAFSHVPWAPPLETARHWAALPPGRKLLLYHPRDRVIGAAAALHTALQTAGALHGTQVIQLGGAPCDAHNEHPGDFAPAEWAAAIAWMRRALQIDSGNPSGT